MKTLKEEAKEYEKQLKARLSSEELASAIVDFVNNSKYVQAEKIKAQIDILENIYYLNKSIKDSLNEFQKQLKNLEDER